MDESNIRSRLARIVLYGVGILLIGAAYGVFVHLTGIAIPCVFRKVTGYKCPGCGITHMCMALMNFRFVDAYNSHPMLFVQLPFLLLIALRNLITYVKSGVSRVNRVETIVIYVCIALLLIFTVYRNIVGM